MDFFIHLPPQNPAKPAIRDTSNVQTDVCAVVTVPGIQVKVKSPEHIVCDSERENCEKEREPRNVDAETDR